MVGFNTGGQNIATQFGMPLFGISGNLPPFTGNSFWVDGTNGSDGNTGGPQDPFKTLSQAQSVCLAGNNDVVYFTGTFSPSATFVWSKNNTHLIGLDIDGPYPTPTIAVVSTAATTGAFSPFVSVTASGCIFQNFSVVSGIAQAATQVAWAESGGSNSYVNVNINQVGSATAGAQAGNRALTIASTSNFFLNCVIGSDALIRATGTNSNIGLLDGAGDCIFQNCFMPAYTSVAANTFLVTASTALVGYFIFRNCVFVNNLNNTSGTQMTVGMTFAAASKGVVVLDATTTVAGVAHVSAASVGVQLGGPIASTTIGNTAIAQT